MTTTPTVTLNRYGKREYRTLDGRFKIINTNIVGIKLLKLNSSKPWLVIDSSGIKSLPSQTETNGYSHDAEYRTIGQAKLAIAAIYTREAEEKANASP